jgi:hypothetical protein
MALTYRKPKTNYVLTQTISHNTAGYATGIFFGTMPIGAMPTGIYVDVLVAFSPLISTNRPWMGFSFNTAEWITTAEMELDVLGFNKVYKNHIDNTVTPIPLATDRNVYFTGFGSPTAGKAIIRVTFDL